MHLPVSAMIHIPRAQEVLDPDGSIDTSKIENNNNPVRWQKYYGRCFLQLEWWAEVRQRHQELPDLFDKSLAFVKLPNQRNVP
jgi:chromate reductase